MNMKTYPNRLQRNELFTFLIVFFFLFIYNSIKAQSDTLSLDKLRTESGVDPTRVNSRIGYSVLYFDKSDNIASVSNRLNLSLGVNRWSFSIKPEIITLHNGVPGTGFNTGFSDLKFSILNAFYISGKNSVAGSIEFNLPFGKQDFGSQYFSATPAITYAYTINTSLFFAIQPQYTFDIAKDELFPDLSVLTIRIFLAKFTKKGTFFVFEPRTVIDFESNNFDLILSPIIGKSLGAGFNLIGLMEIPTKQSTFDSRGVLYQLGFNKNF
jgi:hypothetical protein